ncbi:glycosyltransferase family 2 protein [Granulibacter bethesdensis]|uniref:glycosyltransferase family 2 protein n=1 Tax=Granulibacter bethesdensis TaxID=364410 RepID=UPI00090A9CEF|nr:glycosyltransferase family 2 protein [Granulibacter bethesdensis]APH60775.1 Glycosyltransferase involved in cell wall biogenesis [Granulibacter bethesdensis]
MPGDESVSRIVIVIPAYQEEKSVGDIVIRCRASVRDARILVVDDGSRDATAQHAEAAGAEVLSFPANAGKGASLAAGLAAACAMEVPRIVTLDADGQHRPEDLPRLIQVSERYPDMIVIGSRRRDHAPGPWIRRAANRVADAVVSWASGWPIEDTQSGMRVYPALLLPHLLNRIRSGGFAYESELLIEAGRQGIRTVSVDIPRIHGPALHRPSHFRPLKDVGCIGAMTWGRLWRTGFCPVGLARLLFTRPQRS